MDVIAATPSVSLNLMRSNVNPRVVFKNTKTHFLPMQALGPEKQTSESIEQESL